MKKSKVTSDKNKEGMVSMVNPCVKLCDYLSRNLCVIVMIMILFFFISNVLLIFLNDVESRLSALANVATIFTAFIAGCGLCYAIREYNLHKQRMESDTLAKFNERYSTDKNILRTIDELFQKAEKEDEKKKEEASESEINDMSCEKRVRHEMFFRFFEELQIAIENKALKEDTVCYMFGYYAIAASKYQLTEEQNDESKTWHKFNEFVETMKRVAKENKYFPELLNEDSCGER